MVPFALHSVACHGCPNMSKEMQLTRTGVRLLRKQREALQDELRQSTREMGESIKRDNDLRENPEFLQLQTKISYELPNKISEISRMLDSHTLIEESEAIRNGDFSEVLPGMQVELISETGEKRIVLILGFGEGEPSKGIVSYLTPVAQMLLHKGVGDEVQLPFQGKTTTYEIKAVSKSPTL